MCMMVLKVSYGEGGAWALKLSPEGGGRIIT